MEDYLNDRVSQTEPIVDRVQFIVGVCEGPGDASAEAIHYFSPLPPTFSAALGRRRRTKSDAVV